jgi:hypothetical protein
MLLLRHNSSLPDLDASSIRLRSSSYPSYNTIPSKHFTSCGPSEEILSNYVHTNPPSHPPLSMYSSSQDQRDSSLVDPWLPAPSSAGVSQSADPNLPALSNTISRSTYSPPHSTSSSAPLDDPPRHTRFLHTSSGSSSARQSFSHQPPVSLSRHLSEPNIRAVAAQSGHNYPLPTVAEHRYQQQERRQHQSFQHGVLPSPSSASFSVDQRPSTAGSATSSGWERRDVRAEPIQEVTAVPTQGAHTSLRC